VICWFGHDLKGLAELSIPNLYTDRLTHPLNGKKLDDEESALSEYLPAKLKRPCLICGDAVFAHFAYFTQRPYLEFFTTILDQYRDVVSPGRKAAAANGERRDSFANWVRVLSSRRSRNQLWRARWPEIAAWRDKTLKRREQMRNQLSAAS
jgi:hypothetical protein